MLFKKPIAMVKHLLLQGMSPRRLAWSVALGAVLGIFPVLGVTTLMCIAAGWALRLNHALIQAVNYAVYPLQILFLGGFYAAGNQWLGGGGASPVVADLPAQLSADPWGGVLALKQLTLFAITVWLAVSPLVAIALYYPTRILAARFLGALPRRPGDAV